MASLRLPDLSHERAALAGGASLVAGIDEVGRGPWAGPVVACAAILTGAPPEGVTDSKKLSAKRRAALVPPLEACCTVGYGAASVAEIDALNIRQATHLAMERAVAALTQTPDHLLIDGRDRPAWATGPCTMIVGGDGASLSIAAASILAKERRDALMVALGQQFPGYGWDCNAGYGTAAHRVALEQQGVTPHHRRSFTPIRNMLCQTA